MPHRVLIVDDLKAEELKDLVIRSAHLLAGAIDAMPGGQFDVQTETDAKAVAARIRSGQPLPDIIIADLFMPPKVGAAPGAKDGAALIYDAIQDSRRDDLYLIVTSEYQTENLGQIEIRRMFPTTNRLSWATFFPKPQEELTPSQFAEQFRRALTYADTRNEPLSADSIFSMTGVDAVAHAAMGSAGTIIRTSPMLVFEGAPHVGKWQLAKELQRQLHAEGGLHRVDCEAELVKLGQQLRTCRDDSWFLENMAERVSEVFRIIWPILRMQLEGGMGNSKARFYFDVASLNGLVRQLDNEAKTLLKDVSVRLPSLNERDDKVFLAERYRITLGIRRELTEEDKARLAQHTYFPNNLLDLRRSLERFGCCIEPLQLPVPSSTGRPPTTTWEKIKRLRREAELIALLLEWQRSDFRIDVKALKGQHPFLRDLYLPVTFLNECRQAFQKKVHGRTGVLRTQVNSVLKGLRNHHQDREFIKIEMDRIQNDLDLEIADVAKLIQRGKFDNLSDTSRLASLLAPEEVRDLSVPDLKDLVEQRLQEVTRDPWTTLK